MSKVQARIDQHRHNRLAFDRTLLMLACTIAGVISLSLCLFNLIVGEDPQGNIRILQNAGVATMSAVGLVLAYRHRLQASFWVLFIALLASLSISPFVFGLGVRAPGMAVFTVLITLSLFVLNQRSAGLLTLACSVFVIVGYVLERQGVLPGVMASNLPGATNSLLLLLGTYLGAYAIGRAYSKQYEDTLAMAQEANDSKSKFLAMMSHEIRTPMNGMYAAVQLLQDPRVSPDKRERLLQTVKQSTEALLHLLNDILDTSRIEAGQLQLNKKPFAVSDLLTETLALFDVSAQQKGLKLKAELLAGAERVLLGDSARIRQLISNLVGNAIKFTDTGSVTVTVGCEPTDQAQRVILQCTVADTGKGINEEDLALLFKPFSQLDNQNSVQSGTGLGLTLVKNIAKVMNGDAGATSQLGNGSVFWFHVELECA